MRKTTNREYREHHEKNGNLYLANMFPDKTSEIQLASIRSKIETLMNLNMATPEVYKMIGKIEFLEDNYDDIPYETIEKIKREFAEIEKDIDKK